MYAVMGAMKTLDRQLGNGDPFCSRLRNGRNGVEGDVDGASLLDDCGDVALHSAFVEGVHLCGLGCSTSSDNFPGRCGY